MTSRTAVRCETNSKPVSASEPRGKSGRRRDLTDVGGAWRRHPPPPSARRQLPLDTRLPSCSSPHLPAKNSHYSHRVQYGRYVARRLRRAKRLAQAADVETSTALINQRGREWEDAEGPIQDAIADRDAADDDLDIIAQEARHNLAGRSVDAAQKAPYTHIFPDGIGYYTAAPLDQETKRYGELRQRILEHLPDTDPVRIQSIPAIEAAITAFQSAAESLSTARTDHALAGTRLEAIEEAWDKLMDKIYGSLVAELGRKAAESFFPKTKSAKSKPE